MRVDKKMLSVGRESENTRNRRYFPNDFIFRMIREEVDILNQSQIATGFQKHRDPRFPPYAFTEHGAIMRATVLDNVRNINIDMRRPVRKIATNY